MEVHSLKGVYNIWRYFIRYMNGEIKGKFNKEFLDSIESYTVDYKNQVIYIKKRHK